MATLYVIGPVTGKPNDNYAQFLYAKSRLSEAGYIVDIPHDFVCSGVPWGQAMLVSLHRLTRWNHPDRNYERYYDGVAMLDGWEESAGATFESELCRIIGIECRPWREWLEKKKTEEQKETPCSCSNCVYGKGVNFFEGDYIDYECHRFPPKEAESGAVFPCFLGHTCCGEHRLNDQLKP